MSKRRQQENGPGGKFVRLGISLRRSELKVLDRLRKVWRTSRSGAIGRCIASTAESEGNK
jgi:hypothetical protein